MKRTTFSLLLIGLSLALYSCSSEDTVVSSPQKSVSEASSDASGNARLDTDYLRDRAALLNYVRINQERLEYYMDYQQQGLLSLDNVKPANRQYFEEQLKKLNISIQEAKKDANFCVYMETQREYFLSDNDPSIQPNKGQHVSKAPTFGSMYINQNQTLSQEIFYSDQKIAHSIIRLRSSDYSNPLQVTLYGKYQSIGTGQKKKVLITSSTNSVNAVINWTYTSSLSNGKSSWPINVEKSKPVEGVITFHKGVSEGEISVIE